MLKNINNPFYIDFEGSRLAYEKNYELAEQYDGIFVLCISDNVDSIELMFKIYQMYQDPDVMLQDLLDNKWYVKFVRTTFRIVSNDYSRKSMVPVGGQILHHFGVDIDIDLDYIVVPVFETKYSIIKSWIDINNPIVVMKHIKDYMALSSMYQNDAMLMENVINRLQYIIDSDYWHKVNIDSLYKYCQLQTKKRENGIIVSPPVYGIDELEIISYSRPHIKRFRPETLSIDVEMIKELMYAADDKLRYYLLCHTLISFSYCHVILTDPDLLDMYGDIFAKYKGSLRYYMSYAMVQLLMEEKKDSGFIRLDARYIFTATTASKLPSFPFGYYYEYKNPYYTDLYSRSELQVGPLLYVEVSGVVTPREFRGRLNIFATGNNEIDPFKYVDWTDKVITGSVMAALMPIHNPLMKNGRLSTFYDKYYGKSDIDVCSGCTSFCDYITSTIKFADDISKAIDHAVDISVNKTLVIYISYNHLRKCCTMLNIDFDDTIKTLNNHKLLIYLYDIFANIKMQNRHIHHQLIGEFNHVRYLDIYQAHSFENMRINVKYDFDKEVAENNASIGKYYSTDETGVINIKFKEGLKYKLSSNGLKVDIDYFMGHGGKDYFKTIERFHLPCVKSYYDGTDCYILPSALIAYMTLINIDFRPFYGSEDRMGDIIHKYRKRGYTTLLDADHFRMYESYLRDSNLGRVGNLGYMHVESTFFGGKGGIAKNIKSSRCDVSEIMPDVTQNHRIIPPQKWFMDAAYEMS